MNRLFVTDARVVGFNSKVVVGFAAPMNVSIDLLCYSPIDQFPSSICSEYMIPITYSLHISSYRFTRIFILFILFILIGSLSFCSPLSAVRCIESEKVELDSYMVYVKINTLTKNLFLIKHILLYVIYSTSTIRVVFPDYGIWTFAETFITSCLPCIINEFINLIINYYQSKQDIVWLKTKKNNGSSIYSETRIYF